MKTPKFTLLKKKSIYVALTLFLQSVDALAVTQYRSQSQVFITDPSEMRTSISLPGSAKIEKLDLPARMIKTRTKRAEKDERIEPIGIFVAKDEKALDQLVKQLAQKGQENKLHDILVEKMRKKGPTNETKVKIILTEDVLPLINMDSLSRLLAKTHHNVVISGDEIFKNPDLRKELFAQIKPFFSKNDRQALWNKMKHGETVHVDEELLPSFAEKMVKKYIPYRGPNCFHAALSFHGQKLSGSPLVNVKEEKGYHSAMINYDELWRVINSHFYEVNPKESPMKYGDMVVFFNVPKNKSAPMDFHWIRHTATYLFGPYTFSKGSKSPDTPYSVKTLTEEWETWRTYTENLGVKIYRRNSQKMKKAPPIDLTDWIY